MLFFEQILENNILLAPLIAWLSSQCIKITIDGITILIQKNKEDNISDNKQKNRLKVLLFRTGGMPSSHAATVSSVTMIVGFESGFSSSVFIVSLFFSAIVIRDAVGVRQMVGELCKCFNDFTRTYHEDHHNKVFSSIKVIEGHSPSEVIIGLLLGSFISIVIHFF